MAAGANGRKYIVFILVSQWYKSKPGVNRDLTRLKAGPNKDPNQERSQYD